MKKTTSNYRTGKLERFNYSFYFLGQGMTFVIIYSFLQQYALDAGISALMFAGVALAIKGWDAINDPIFGVLLEKVHLKGGKYIPWIRLSVIAIPLTTVLIFAIPSGLPMGWKVAWLVIAYVLWDTAYTIGDVPIYAMSTAMTDNTEERTFLISRGRFFGSIAMFLPMFLLPLVRSSLGGWTNTVLVFGIFCLLTMIPVSFTAKERVQSESENGKDPTLKEMLRYVVGNKYLLIFYIAFVLYYTFNISSTMSLIVARHCFGNEAYSSLMSLALLAPPMICALLVPVFIKFLDKYHLFLGSLISMNLLLIVTYFVGYSNFTAFILLTLLRGVGYGFVSTLLYTFIGDCCEYGTFKTGIDAKGVAFAAHTFFTKLMGATATALSSVCLAVIGYVEGEGATQLATLPDNLWKLFCLVPVLGMVLAMPIFLKYKLNDKDVAIMAKCNSGVITREDAEATLSRKY